MEQLSGKDLAKLVAYSINSLNFKEEDFCEQMHKEHKTLQQNFMRLIFEYIRSTADQKSYDERNAASVAAARELLRVIETEHMSLPYI